MIEFLGGQELRRRRAAAWAPGGIASARAEAPLIRALEDSDEGLRLTAVASLIEIGTPEALPAAQAARKAFRR